MTGAPTEADIHNAMRQASETARHVFHLTDHELQFLSVEAVGQGGFQSFARKLQRQLTGGALLLTDEDFGKAVRYAHYDRGGFEGRLAHALARNMRLAITGMFG